MSSESFANEVEQVNDGDNAIDDANDTRTNNNINDANDAIANKINDANDTINNAINDANENISPTNQQ